MKIIDKPLHFEKWSFEQQKIMCIPASSFNHYKMADVQISEMDAKHRETMKSCDLVTSCSYFKICQNTDLKILTTCKEITIVKNNKCKCGGG
jgi:hypothetical protein